MKSNPYVFPSLEFANLDKCNSNIKVKKKEVLTLNEILSLLKRNFVELDEFTNNFMPHLKNSNLSKVEKFKKFFNHDFLLFGSWKFTEKYIDSFSKTLERSNYLNLVIMGFPFKIHVPLKTFRVYPDAGELLMFLKLEKIAVLLEELLQLNIKIYVIAEDLLASAANIPYNDASVYLQSLKSFKTILNLNHINIIPFSNLRSYINFRDRFCFNLTKLKIAYKNKDEKVLKKVSAVKEIFLRLLNTSKFPYVNLCNVYKKIQKPQYDISQDLMAQEIFNYLYRIVDKKILEYFALLETRDDFDFIRNEIGENYIHLSVSPKSGRIGWLPLNLKNNILPYHGLPIISRGNIRIEYLHTLKSSDKAFKAIYWKDDFESLPFLLVSNNE